MPLPSTGLSILPIAPSVSTSLDVATAVGGSLPPAASVRGARLIQNQLEVPCCVSCAFITATESARAAWPELSPLFHYFVTRTEKMRLPAAQPALLTLETAVDAIRDIGISSLELHSVPMDGSGVGATPAVRARQDAQTRRLPASGIAAITHVQLLADAERVLAWKKALLARRPIVAGIQLPKGYGPEMRKAPWPAISDGVFHAVAILGYRDSEQAFVVQDSRGPDWFLGGQWYMPYAFAQSSFVLKAYALRAA